MIVFGVKNFKHQLDYIIKYNNNKYNDFYSTLKTASVKNITDKQPTIWYNQNFNNNN